MDASFKLKLLNGPLAGRELFLPLGPFTVGGGDSDLSLPLEGGAVATLEVSADAVSLGSRTPCWVGGRSRPSGPLPPNAAIDMAGLHFVLGPADAELGAPKAPPRDGLKRSAAAILAATLALAAAFAWAAMPADPPAAPGPRAWLPQALAAEPGLSARWLDGGGLLLSGRCRSSEKLSALTARLRAAGVRLRQETVCDDELRRSVRALLGSYGYPDVTVSLDAQGRADIDGQVESDARFAELSAALDQLPGLQGWRFTDRGADALAALLDRLRQAGLLSGLSAARTEQGWVLSGQLDAARQAALDALLARFNAEAGKSGRFRFISAASTAQPADYLPAAISGVGGNVREPYLELANGMRLQPGSPIKRSMRIVAITPAGVSIAGNRQLVFLPLHG